MGDGKKVLFSISELRPFLFVAGYGCLSDAKVGQTGKGPSHLFIRSIFPNINSKKGGKVPGEGESPFHPQYGPNKPEILTR